MNERIVNDAKKALHGLVPEGIITGKPTTDFEKRVDDVLNKFAESPRSVSNKEMIAVGKHEDSHIGNPKGYFPHVSNVGKIFPSAIILLQKKYNDTLDLPHPDDGRVYGGMHDFSATFSNYKLGDQHSKELDLYFVAEARGMDLLALEVAPHSDYLGIARLMSAGRPFPKQEVYTGMIEVLQENGPLSYKVIKIIFSDFLASEANLPLIVLSAIDLIEHGQTTFTPETIDVDFRSKFIDDVLVRYTEADSLEEMSPLGQAYLDGGSRRMQANVNILKDLALGDPVEMREKYAHTSFFR